MEEAKVETVAVKESEEKQSVTITSSDKPKKEKKSKRKKEDYEFSEIEMTVMDKKNLAVTGHLKSSKGDGALVMRLISSKDVDVNDGDYDKRTALHISVCEGHVEIVKSLVEAGANVNCADRWGATPLDEAIRHGQDEIAELLQKKGGKHGTATDFGLDLINAASKGDLETVQKLVKSGVSVQSCDYDKRSPLHVAVAERHLYLIENGANVEAVDRFGGTPVMEAERVKTRLGSDPIVDLLKEAAGHGKEEHKKSLLSRIKNPFVIFVAFFQIAFGILFAIFMQYDPQANGTTPISEPNDVNRIYGFYMDVHVMIFIGFGFLMTFLRKHGYGSVGVNMLLGCIALQWYLLVGPFWERVYHDEWTEKINVSIVQLIRADFAAGAVLITFGALLGKVSSLQLAVVCIVEVVFFAINENISLTLKVADLGGSMVIHLFGAYFGLASSIMLTPPGAKGNKDNSAVYRSDLFSMIGTIFLWIYWPSFNAALGNGGTQHRAVVNTVLSLSASCVAAFVASQFVRNERKFNMVDIQNATLAGGVAIGASADMVIHPAVCLLIGAFSGCVSVFGFAYVQPFIEKHVGIHDTCGVNNLHGMPAIIGAISSMIAASVADYDLYASDQLTYVFPERVTRSASKQASFQVAFFFITLGISITSGFFTGYFVRHLEPKRKFFLDEEEWEVPELETPYYFDRRGEIIRELSHEHEKPKPQPVTDVAPQLEARIAGLEKTIKGILDKSKEQPKESKEGGDIANITSVMLLQSLTQKVDQLLFKELALKKE